MFAKITNPVNNKSYSIFSPEGKKILKSYVKKMIGGSQNSTQPKFNPGKVVYDEIFKRKGNIHQSVKHNVMKLKAIERLKRKISSIKSNIRYLDERLSDASHTMGHWSGRMEYEMLEGQIRRANVELLDSLGQLRMLLRN